MLILKIFIIMGIFVEFSLSDLSLILGAIGSTYGNGDDDGDGDDNKKKDGKDEIQFVRGGKEKRLQKIIMSDSQMHGLYSFPEPLWKAVADMTSNLKSNNDTDDTEGISGTTQLRGAINFFQWNGDAVVKISVNLNGLPPGKHAVHIHSFGDLSEGCKSTGTHMPTNFIGNIEAKKDGSVVTQFYSGFMEMFGVNGIVGRSVVIHEKPLENNPNPIFSAPPLTFRSEEMEVGDIIGCGIVTIKSNLM